MFVACCDSSSSCTNRTRMMSLSYVMRTLCFNHMSWILHRRRCFIVSCLMGSFICEVNPTNVIARVVFRLAHFLIRPTCDYFHEHTRTARSRKYFLSHLFDIFSRRKIFLLFFHFWRKTYFVQINCIFSLGDSPWFQMLSLKFVVVA